MQPNHALWCYIFDSWNSLIETNFCYKGLPADVYSFKGILSPLAPLTLSTVTNRRGGYPRICILINVQKGLAPFQAQQTYSDVLIALNEDICHQLNNWNRQKRETNPLCGSELQIATWHVTVAGQPHVSAQVRVCPRAHAQWLFSPATQEHCRSMTLSPSGTSRTRVLSQNDSLHS